MPGRRTPFDGDVVIFIVSYIKKKKKKRKGVDSDVTGLVTLSSVRS